MNRTLAEFAQCLRRRAASAPIAPTPACPPTRARSSAGELFVALRGPRFNANDFVAAARSRRRGRRGGRHARRPAARADRRRRHAGGAEQLRRRVARAVLDARRRRRRQQRQDHGQGNDRGDPRRARARRSRRAAISTTTSACRSRCTGSTPTHRFAVIEIGANRAGRSRGARASSRGPTVGLITNAGAEHLEGFGSLEGVARAEGEMVAGLDAARHRGDQCRRRIRRRCGAA